LNITFLGQAGLFIETGGVSILCDPWFGPSYFASWFPFPRNDRLDLRRFQHPTYLYVSHLHRDHFDSDFLRDCVSKDTTVILPDYPLGLLEAALRDLGFNRFVQTRNWEPAELSGLQVTVPSLVAPTDGPIGDSGLIVYDGEVRVFDQNDSRPIEMERLASLGGFDAHFLQFSGAIWYPFVYQFPQAMSEALGRKKRANEMARAFRYIKEVDADWVVPSAGPPCFLDEDLFQFNDFDRDPANTFPDQMAFLDHLREQGTTNGLLMIPGSQITLQAGDCSVEHPLPEPEVRSIFSNKRAYLTEYQTSMRPVIEAAKASWPHGEVDLVSSLKEWFEPLIEKADITCAGVNGVVVLDCGETGVAIDFGRRRVEPWQGQEWDYYFKFDRRLIEYCVVNHLEDWVNELFLSCRFEAQRKGPFNEYVYNFFKCLSMERLQYAEGYYAEKAPIDQFWESNGYRIQRRCPHLKADLSRFAEIENGVLTCTLHGWQFELATGRCLTSDDRRLYAEELGSLAATRPPEEHVGATVRNQCGHCSYKPTGSEGGVPTASEGGVPVSEKA
jgi:UDP-MurNAc hydroxylase